MNYFYNYIKKGLPNVLVIDGKPIEKWYKEYNVDERYNYLMENLDNGANIAIIPKELDMVVLDIDSCETLDVFNEPYFAYPSKTKGHSHMWYNIDNEYKYKNVPQQEIGDVKFDIIYSKLITIYDFKFFELIDTNKNEFSKFCPLYISDSDLKWSNGNRNENFRHYFWNLLVKKKFNYYEESEHTKSKFRFDQLKNIALASGMSESEIKATINSALKKVNSIIKQTDCFNSFFDIDYNKIKPIYKYDIESINNAFGINMKMNEIVKLIEYFIINKDTYKPVDDDFISCYRLTIYKLFPIIEHDDKKGILVNDKLLRDEIVNYSYINSYNPIKEWIVNLKWDGIERCKNWFIENMGVEDTSMHRRFSKILFVGMTKRIFEPGCVFDNMFILGGAQGIGKTKTIVNILPDNFRKYINEAIDLDDKYSEIVNNVIGKVIVIIDDVKDLKKMEISKVKRLVTTQNDTVTRKYEKFSIILNRSFTLFATTNEDYPIPLDYQNRRFMYMKCFRQLNDPVDKMIEDREQLFAEAYQLYMNGYDINITHEEQDELEEINSHLQNEDVLLEFLKDEIDNKYKNICQSFENYRGNVFVNRKKFREILKRNGFGNFEVKLNNITKKVKILGWDIYENPVKLDNGKQCRGFLTKYKFENEWGKNYNDMFEE